MKNLFLVAISVAFLISCNSKVEKNTEENSETLEIAANDMSYQSFGEKITDTDVMTKAEMFEKYKNLKSGDTVNVKFMSEVNSVCQNKGCWMRLNMEEEEALIKFKDYGFFMPKDIAGESVIVEGIAYVDEMSVEDQRHFAEDAGKTEEEIAAITEPKRTLSFTANGVLLAEKE
jgi:hypothetical protein